MITTLLQDIRYGARMLSRQPAFAAIIIVILALGIGANSAVFSVVNAVVLRPLPYKAAGRICLLASEGKMGSQWISAPDFLAWQERTRVFEVMAAAEHDKLLLTGADIAEEAFTLGISRECLPMLGVPAALGRTFADDDYREGAPRTVLLSHKLWNRRFGGDPRTVGKNILVDGRPTTVVGVMPPAFQFPFPYYEMWLPMTFSASALSRRDGPAFAVYARLKPGVTMQQAEQEARLISGALAKEFPESHDGVRMAVTPLQEESLRRHQPKLLVLLGAVGFVLLIACLNVANLLLVRAAGRAKEMAIRASLGAPRLRLVRQLLTESVLLALLGGAFGLLFAFWSNRVLLAIYPEKIPLPRLEQTSIDVRVLGFTLLVAVASGILFGLAPAAYASSPRLVEQLKLENLGTTGLVVFYASSPRLVEQLKESGRGALRGHRGRFRSLLMVAEVSLSLVLLVGAGLMIRTFVRLMRVNPGFTTERLLTVQLPLPSYRMIDRKRSAPYYAGILEQVRTVPGLRSAALVTVLPLTGFNATLSTDRPGKHGEKFLPYRAVSPGYFRTMGIPVLMGRAFEDGDTAQS